MNSNRALRTLQTQGRRVEGAPSFRTAPMLEPGSYTDTIVPGEALFWGVPLKFGQQLNVKATVDRPGETDGVGSVFEVLLVNPKLREFGRDYKVNLSGRVVSVGTTTGPVDPSSKETDTRVEGTYYVRLAYKASGEGTQERPIEFSIEVSGATATTTTVAADKAPATDQVAAAPAAKSTESSNTGLLTAVLVVGGLVVILLVVLILTLRRRPSGPPPT